MLRRLEAGEVEYLGLGRVPAVKIAVDGESFMFNMIRHLVGMSVAVARGALPLEFVEPSLCMSALCTCAPVPSAAAMHKHPVRVATHDHDRTAHLQCETGCSHHAHGSSSQPVQVGG